MEQNNDKHLFIIKYKNSKGNVKLICKNKPIKNINRSVLIDNLKYLSKKQKKKIRLFYGINDKLSNYYKSLNDDELIIKMKQLKLEIID